MKEENFPVKKPKINRLNLDFGQLKFSEKYSGIFRD
jgi:hypothetical protein